MKQNIHSKKIFDILTFSDFWALLDQTFTRFWTQKTPKSRKKVKRYRKSTSYSFFCFIFVWNLAKNGHIRVFRPKFISIFRFWKSFGTSCTNAQLRDIIARQWKKLFPLCKKFLEAHTLFLYKNQWFPLKLGARNISWTASLKCS